MEWYSKSFGVTAFAAIQMIAFLSALASSEFRSAAVNASSIISMAIVGSAIVYLTAIIFFHMAGSHTDENFQDYTLWFVLATIGQASYITLLHAAGFFLLRHIARLRAS